MEIGVEVAIVTTTTIRGRGKGGVVAVRAVEDHTIGDVKIAVEAVEAAGVMPRSMTADSSNHLVVERAHLLMVQGNGTRVVGMEVTPTRTLVLTVAIQKTTCRLNPSVEIDVGVVVGSAIAAGVMNGVGIAAATDKTPPDETAIMMSGERGARVVMHPTDEKTDGDPMGVEAPGMLTLPQAAALPVDRAEIHPRHTRYPPRAQVTSHPVVLVVLHKRAMEQALAETMGGVMAQPEKEICEGIRHLLQGML